MSSSFRCFALLAFLLILLLAPGCKHREIRSWAPDLRDLDWLAEHDYRPDRYRGKSLAHVRDDYTAGSWRRRSEQEGVRSGEPPAAGAGQVAGEPGPGARELTDKRKEFIRWLWVRGPDFVYNAFKLRAREEPSRDPQLAQSTLLERHHILKELEETSLANAQRLLFQYRSEFEEIDRSRETVRRREAARRKAGKGQQYSSGVSGGSEERIQTPNLFAKRCGLALSGGGIRSASFATGVLLGLHEIGLLNEFGYLSTVSGGGYAGAWYMLQGNPDELLTPGSQHLHHLAQSGNYLVSVHASDSFGELALKAGTHFGLMPVHWLVNGLFDLDLNVPIARTSYRWGIEQAFLYDESKMFAREEGRKDYGSMAFFSPVTRTRHPFWIINMHVALSDETTPVHRNRTGDAFEVTPLRAGADAVGYSEVNGLRCAKPLQFARTVLHCTRNPGAAEEEFCAALLRDTPELKTLLEAYREEIVDGRGRLNEARRDLAREITLALKAAASRPNLRRLVKAHELRARPARNAVPRSRAPRREAKESGEPARAEGQAPAPESGAWLDLVIENTEAMQKAFDGSLVLDEPSWWMQPNYACAISGAAADSLSFKEGPWVRLLYAVINFDLGYDVESWNQGWRHEDGSQVRLKDVGFYFTSLAPLQLPLAWLFGGVRGIVTALSGERSSIHGGELWHKHTQWAKYFHLSDGGHFDNLGAYALVRRGCRFIVISDAEEDPLVDRWDSLANDDRARAFVALRELEKTLYADFGAVLEMEWDTFRVQPPEGWTSGFGNGPRSTFLVGRIRNLPVALQCGARDGDVVILYLRAAYGIDTELRRSATFLDAEKADNAEFPNDPTFPRQFFSERQVVAYRHLGRQLVLNNAREILCHFKDTRRAFSHGIRDRSGAPCPCWRKTLAEKFFGQTGSGRSALSLYSSGLQTNTIPAVATALVEVLVHGLKDILMREEEH